MIVPFFLVQDGPPLLKLIDFGCSQQLPPDGSQLIKRKGTPVFMAPEVYRQSYRESADVWSLGMMSFLCLTGRFPFWPTLRHCMNCDVTEVMRCVLHEPLVLGDDITDALSPAAVDLLRRMLQRDPQRRISVSAALQHPWFGQITGVVEAEHSSSNIVPFALNQKSEEHVSAMSVWRLMQGSYFPLELIC